MVFSRSRGEEEAGFMRTKPSLRGVALYGPHPVHAVFLRCKPGVTALYGLNGAGKSQILAALLSATTGREMPSLFHYSHYVAIEAPIEHEVSEAPSEYGGGFLWHVADRRGPRRVDRAGLLEYLTQEILGQAWAPLASEVIDQGCFAFVDHDETRSVWAAAVPSTQTPLLRRAWDLIASKATEARRDEPLPWSVPSSETSGRVIEPSSDLSRFPTGLYGPQAEVETDVPTPAWLPQPALWLFDTHGAGPDRLLNVLSEGDSDLAEATLHRVRRAMTEGDCDAKSLLEADIDGHVVVAPAVLEYLADLSHKATEIASDLLLDAPSLGCWPQAPDDWAYGGSDRIPSRSNWCMWMAHDVPTGTFLSLHLLSQAQRRWCELAVRAAMEDSVDLVVIDEPEAALHARAERHMVSGLKKLAQRLKACVVVATHSAAMLRDEAIGLQHVTRSTKPVNVEGGRRFRHDARKGSPIAGSIVVNEMPPLLRAGLSDLGLDAADLLQLVRVFLIVEGRHDEVVLETLIGAELEELRARVVPARGAKHLASMIDSQLIFDFTEAATLVVLDNTQAGPVRQAWDDARFALASEGASTATAILKERLSTLKTAEERFLREMCWKAVETGKAMRVEVFGLSAGCRHRVKTDPLSPAEI